MTQLIRVVGRIITVIFKFSLAKEKTLSININDILGHDFAIIPSNIFIAVRNNTIECEKSNDDNWKICLVNDTINDVEPEDKTLCQEGTTFFTNGSHVMVKGKCEGRFTVHYHGKDDSNN